LRHVTFTTNIHEHKTHKRTSLLKVDQRERNGRIFKTSCPCPHTKRWIGYCISQLMSKMRVPLSWQQVAKNVRLIMRLNIDTQWYVYRTSAHADIHDVRNVAYNNIILYFGWRHVVI